MNKSLLYRGLLILGVVALFAWSALPLDEKINLGLDLRGGMYLVLEVQTDDAVDSDRPHDRHIQAPAARWRDR